MLRTITQSLHGIRAAEGVEARERCKFNAPFGFFLSLLRCNKTSFHRSSHGLPPPALPFFHTQINYHNYKINFDVCIIARELSCLQLAAHVCLSCCFFNTAMGAWCAPSKSNQMWTKTNETIDAAAAAVATKKHKKTNWNDIHIPYSIGIWSHIF